MKRRPKLWRKLKKFEGKMYPPPIQAYYEGEYAGGRPMHLPKRLRTNPYPPGRRHDEWERGYKLADPMGDHHGRNE